MSNLDRVAKLLRRRRRQWISALDLMNVGGWLSWRSRLPELRRMGWVIENRVRRVGKRNISEYRYRGKAA